MLLIMRSNSIIARRKKTRRKNSLINNKKLKSKNRSRKKRRSSKLYTPYILSQLMNKPKKAKTEIEIEPGKEWKFEKEYDGRSFKFIVKDKKFTCFDGDKTYTFVIDKINGKILMDNQVVCRYSKKGLNTVLTGVGGGPNPNEKEEGDLEEVEVKVNNNDGIGFFNKTINFTFDTFVNTVKFISNQLFKIITFILKEFLLFCWNYVQPVIFTGVAIMLIFNIFAPGSTGKAALSVAGFIWDPNTTTFIKAAVDISIAAAFVVLHLAKTGVNVITNIGQGLAINANKIGTDIVKIGMDYPDHTILQNFA